MIAALRARAVQALKLIHWTATGQLPHRYRLWKAWQNRVELAAAYERWVARCDTIDERDRALIRAEIAGFAYRPLISVAMPTYDTDDRLLREAVASVQAQLYPHWELCIADDHSPDPRVGETIRELAAADPRIKWVVREANGNISAASNTALSLAAGEFTALMDHDDLLPEHALYRIARELQNAPDLNVLYSDEDQIDAEGRRHSPYFKPAWNLDLLLGHNVVSHLGVYRTSLLREIGGFRLGYEGSQDYDLALRAVAASPAGTIRHVPAVLYHWRRLDEGSFSQAQLQRCIDAARRAVADFLAAIPGPPGARISSLPGLEQWMRVHWPLPDPQPSVSIVIPTRDRADLLERCVTGLLERTRYQAFEIVIVDNGSVEPETKDLLTRLTDDRRVRVLESPGAFNYARLNNEAIRQVRSDVVVLLNNDIDVIDADWLAELVSHAIRPDIGAVGAKLLYADDRIQHAGVALGAGEALGEIIGVAGHFGHLAGRDDLGYSGQLALTRELSAVTAACMALRREVFEAVGGFDETALKVAFNDVDLCLRIRQKGWRIVWTPFAELYHLESQTRGSDLQGANRTRFKAESRTMQERWRDVLQADPFYNVNFQRGHIDFRLDFENPTSKPWRASRDD